MIKKLISTVILLAGVILYSNDVAAVERGRAPEITLRGNQFLKDGRDWRAKGIDIETFITCKSVSTGKYGELRGYWGAEFLEKLRQNYHIDTLRFQVSQIGLDPQSGLCGPDYKIEIEAAVRLARQHGFVVVVSMDWQTPTGIFKPIKELSGMPDEQTLRAWRNLAPVFADDGGVLYELFVEAKEGASDQATRKWSMGIQPVIEAVRQAGATNIILLDGLNFGRVTRGLDRLFHDPLPGRWGFVVDPQYTEDFNSPRIWDEKFGNTAETYPTLAAGFTFTDRPGCVSGLSPAEAVTTLFRYLRSKDMGLILWGDYPETLWHGNNPDNPTNFDHFTACHDNSFSGPGELFAKWTP